MDLCEYTEAHFLRGIFRIVHVFQNGECGPANRIPVTANNLCICRTIAGAGEFHNALYACLLKMAVVFRIDHSLLHPGSRSRMRPHQKSHFLGLSQCPNRRTLYTVLSGTGWGASMLAIETSRRAALSARRP